MKKLSQKEYRKNAKRDEIKCPVCGRENKGSYRFVVAPGSRFVKRKSNTCVELLTTCEDCGTNFFEIFELKGFRVEKKNEDPDYKKTRYRDTRNLNFKK